MLFQLQTDSARATLMPLGALRFPLSSPIVALRADQATRQMPDGAEAGMSCFKLPTARRQEQDHPINSMAKKWGAKK